MSETADEFDVAIVGMACRLPGARTLDEFWRNLTGGVESIRRLTDEEILASGVPAAYLGMPNYVKAAPVLDEPGHFAASFFGFTPAEARALDPQHRILLELAHEALENAGVDPARYSGRIGVFAGSALNTYFTNVGLNERLADDYIPTLIGNDKDFLATRISYKLNLKGPSITVQTACSTSLVAVHLARQSLLSGEIDLAVVGAISVRVPHFAGYVADSGGVVSPDGHVRAFDARANGTVFGSGGGVLVLTRLGDALTAGSRIRAVIKGSAVNNDGQAKAGYTAPSVNGQMDAMAEALANAGVPADSIGYVEAHGSGTPVGDPIELAALTKAFRTETERSGFCAIGSVKTNVGHLDVAAGLAGIMKTVLSLEHGQIPASLHFTEGNPDIDFPSTPFYVNTRLRDWTSDGARRAAVMATGMGGTNACLVLEEAPAPTPSSPARPPHLLVLSAKTETALDAATRELGEFLAADDHLNMSDVAFTLQTGRPAHRHRRYLVCASREDAGAAFGDPASKRLRTGQSTGAKRPIVFMVPGIGDHYVGMGFDLYESQPVFREAVDECARLLQAHTGVDIRTILYPSSRSWQKRASGKGVDLKAMLANRTDAAADPEAATLNQTLYAQPALFTIEYATAKLWESLGVVPDAIVCHSMGEYVAACLAGVLSLEDAARLIATRAALVNALPQGAMLAVMLSEQELLPLLGARLSISLINGPKLCVVAGPPEDVAELEKALSAKGIIARHVQNAHAFHSRMLDPIVGPFQAEVRKARLGEPRIPYTSNVTGAWITAQEAKDPAYWGKHANHTARFSDALQAMWQLDNPVLIEIGPGRTLGVLAAQHPGKPQTSEATVVASLRPRYEQESDTTVLVQGVGQLWLAGVEPRWENLYTGERRSYVPLPTYPFERQEFWISRDAAKRGAFGTADGDRTDAAPESIDDWFFTPVWQKTPLLTERLHEGTQQEPFWLVIGDRYGGGARASAAIQSRGYAAAWARFGDRFGKSAEGAFELDPRSADDYRRLLRELQPAIRGPLHILHFGSLIRGSTSGTSSTVSNAQDFGLYSLLHLAQAIGDLGIDLPIKIGVVSNRMHEVTGDEVLVPEMAPVLGPCGVIPKEYPNVECFNVDLPGGEAADALSDETLAHVFGEFAEASENGVVAYRGRHRWRRTYTEVRLPPLVPSAGNHAAVVGRFRQGGVYLITGGTGGIGMVIARHLAAAYRPKILLTKKHAFPPKSAWKEMASAGYVEQSVRETIAALLELEELGAEVEVFVAEVSDREQMQQVIRSAVARYGAIHGVIHAAGIVRAGMIQAKSRETVEAVLAPKVDGTVILFDLLADVRPDFLVLFSSITSVLAPYAEADYSGANAFLDAFDCYANSRGGYPTITINWPGWKEVGQLVKLEAQPGVERWKAAAMSRAIASKDGLEAFLRILQSGLDRVIVTPEPLHDLLEHEKHFDPAEYLAQTSGAPPVRREEVGAAESSELEEVSDVEAAVRDVWLKVFGFDRVGIHETFAALGGHSLIAMQIVAQVKSQFGIDFTLRDFFTAPTIAGVSAEVERRILQEIESMSDEEAQQLVRAMDAGGGAGARETSVDR